MSNIDTPARDDETVADRPIRTSVSRRTLIKTAAGAGVVAATVGIVGVASANSAHHPAGAAGTSGASLTGVDSNTAASGPIMVHLVDQASGTVEVFTPTSQTRIQDHDLATRIARAAGN